MEHKKSPDYRQLVQQFRNVGCSERQITNMLLHKLEKTSKMPTKNRWAKPLS